MKTLAGHARILLVEDDHKLARLVQEFLTEAQLDVTWVESGEDALAHVRETPPALLILDIMLPGMDGLAVCRELRPSFHGAILMLTARGDEVDEIVGLELGADDYLAKPVHPRLLLARVKALLRRTQQASDLLGAESSLHRFAEGLEVDASKRAVRLMGTEIQLTTAEFDLLLLLAENVGQVVTRETLYQELRGIEYDGLDRTVDIRVSKLRKKLGEPADQPALVKGVRGVGYLLAATRLGDA